MIDHPVFQRGDYLLRDSLHCGVSYGIYDSNRLIESLVLIRNPDSDRLQLALERGGEHTFEAMILARYQMNTQVYFHKIRRIYDHYLQQYSRSWGPDNYRSLDDVLQYDDLSVTMEIRKDARSDGFRRQWAERIVNRRHHKSVYQTGDSADARLLQKAKQMIEELRNRFSDCDFYLDDSPVSIYKLWVRGDQEELQIEDLYIREPTGKLTLLTDDSAIVSKIPKKVRTVRIFADGWNRHLTQYASTSGIRRIYSEDRYRTDLFE